MSVAILVMTPDPRGFPRQSPLHAFVPSRPLTDKRIEELCVNGWYGRDRKLYWSAILRGRKLLQQQRKQKLTNIQSEINDLTT